MHAPLLFLPLTESLGAKELVPIAILILALFCVRLPTFTRNLRRRMAELCEAWHSFRR